MSDADTHGQIEGVGVVLLTALVVVAVATFGAFYLGSLDGGGEALAALDVRLEPADGGNVTVTVTHGGGQSLAATETVVVLRDEAGNEARPTLADGTLPGARPETFDAGETWTWTWDSGESYAVGDRLRVLVVHRGTESVPFDSPVTVREGETATLAPKYEPPTPGGGDGGAGDGDGEAGDGDGDGDGDGGAGDGGDGGDGITDMNSPYLDTNGNWQYDEAAGDVELTWSQLEAGYDAPTGGAVVMPPSSGTSGQQSLSGLDVTADGIYVGLDLVVDTNQRTTLDAGSGRLRMESVTVRNDLQSANSELFLRGESVEATGVTVRSKQTIDIDGGSITVDGATLSNAGQNANGRISISASGGDLVAADASITSKSQITLESSAGVVNIAGATIDNSAQNGNEQVTIRSSADVVDAAGVTVRSKRQITIESSADSVLASDATFDNDERNANGDVQLTSANGDVHLNRSKLLTTQVSRAGVSGGTLYVDGTEIRADGNPATLRNRYSAPVVGCPSVGDVDDRPNGPSNCAVEAIAVDGGGATG